METVNLGGVFLEGKKREENAKTSKGPFTYRRPSSNQLTMPTVKEPYTVETV